MFRLLAALPLIPLALCAVTIALAWFAERRDAPASGRVSWVRVFAGAQLLIVVAATINVLAWASTAEAADVAPAGPTPVIVPWGEWTIAIVNSLVLPILLPLLGALAAWILAKLVTLFPWLNGRLQAEQVERLLTNALDYGVNAVTEAAKGKTLTVSTGRAVLDLAVRYAVENGSSRIVKAAGGPEGVATKMFRKMDLEPNATVREVLGPILRNLPPVP